MNIDEASYFRSDLPEGRSGDWFIEKFSVSAPSRSDRDESSLSLGERVRAGTFTRLNHGSETFMTDLYDEWLTQAVAIREACARGGEVLVTGLGLGVAVEGMLRTTGSKVARVTVIEKSADVVALAASHLSERFGDRLRVLVADAFSWRPALGERFTVVWHDIWPNPHDRDRWSEMAMLEQRYRPYCDWQGCWVREYLKIETACDPTLKRCYST